MSNDIFLYELTPIEKGGENENGSGFPIKCTIKNSSMRPCDAREMRLLRRHHYTLIEFGQSFTDDLES